MAHEAVSFRGYAGRFRRRITTEGGVISCEVGRGQVEQVCPASDEWARFWSTVDSLGAWRWQDSYGRMLKDGRPWWLELREGDRSLSTSGNDFEEYAPAGARPLVLALDALLGGRLLQADDARVLRKSYKLAIEVPRGARQAGSESLFVRQLFDRFVTAAGAQGVPLIVHSYTFGPDDLGATFLLDAPPRGDELDVMKSSVGEPGAELWLIDFCTGRKTPL